MRKIKLIRSLGAGANPDSRVGGRVLFIGKRLLQASAFVLLAILLGAHVSNTDAYPRCRGILNLKLEGVTITAAQSIPAATFTPPGSDRAIANLPGFCRVAASLKPARDSNIKIELWMPEKHWNGRFLGTGNGGGAGKISYRALASGLRRGYATANTDMGTSPNADAVVGHPDRWVDFGYRATHEMTVVSKKILASYYRQPQSRSYFVGCSTGGQQSLMEAQRYPADYDGIVAGAPANNRTRLHAGFLWNYKAMNPTPGSTLLLPEKIALVTRAVVAACAGKHGGSPHDNFLTDPRGCKFDPDTIPKCSGTEASGCLTSTEVIALKKIYAGPTNPRTWERIYMPLPFGSENSTLGLAYQRDPASLPEQFYQYRWIFGADFNFRKFDFDHDQDALDAKLGPILNANSPDLDGLKKRGGKLLMYTGTADPLVPFQDALNYYERTVQAQQKDPSGSSSKNSAAALTETQGFFRYFLVPGMGHCGRGPGLNTLTGMPEAGIPIDSEHDVLAATVKWVELGIVPDKITASAFIDRSPGKGIRFQRPICSYPKFPDYVGGDWKSPSSYRCTNHPRNGVLTPATRYLK